MATRNERRRRAKIRKAQHESDRRHALISSERAKAVKSNLAQDNRPTATVRDHLGRVKVIHTTAYSRITDSFVSMVQGGGLRECLNIDRVSGDTDRDLTALNAKIAKPDYKYQARRLSRKR